MIAPVTLALFAVLASTAGGRLLRRSGWPERSPRLGIIAWQALSGSIVVAAVLGGAALALPTLPLTVDLAELLSACAMALQAEYATPGGAALSATGGVFAAVVVGRVGYCLAAELVTARRERTGRLRVLSSIARRHDAVDALVVDHPVPGAYCLPGRCRAIVLTTSALAALDDAQLAAVLWHEQAHLRGRHHLVLAAASALRHAFPMVPAFRDAPGELDRLVEMLADDIAARRSNRLAVATALVRLAEATVPVEALGAGGTTALIRVQRLVGPARPLGAARSTLAALAAAGLLITPVVVVAAPAVVAASSDLCPIGSTFRA